MPVPSALISKYFQLLANRQLTDAEHEMEIIKFYIYSFLPEREFESFRQLLIKEQFNEARQELDRLRQLLADKQSAIVGREFEKFNRNLRSRLHSEIQQKSETIKQFLAKCQFTEAAQEVGKFEQLLIDKQATEAVHELKRFKWILNNKQFAEIAEDLDVIGQLLESRNFAKIERELERLKHKMKRTEWDRGYYRALYGMLLACRSNNNSYTFFSELDLSNKASLHAYRREFLEHERNGRHGDFDRGFFSAWADCMRVLHKIDLSSIPTTNGATTASARKSEAVQTDKNQVTIQDFFKEENV